MNFTSRDRLHLHTGAELTTELKCELALVERMKDETEKPPELKERTKVFALRAMKMF